MKMKMREAIAAFSVSLLHFKLSCYGAHFLFFPPEELSAALERLDQGWANCLTAGATTVLIFDRGGVDGGGSGAAADGGSFLVSHLIGGKIYHGMCRKGDLMSIENEPKQSYNQIRVFEGITVFSSLLKRL